MNTVPTNAMTLMTKVYRNIFPEVNRELHYWQKQAQDIPDAELKSQALASIASKRFHCQGGAVFAFLAGKKWRSAIRFIVAYQTISDYLDNLCDRSTSMDPEDFCMLHESMKDALSLSSPEKNYYRLRENQDDGGYLLKLVRTCQEVLRELSDYTIVEKQLHTLEILYADLQVHKHVIVKERVPRLTNWFEKNKGSLSNLTWYEFSASAGSTLGIFCIISYALGNKITSQLAEDIYTSYFPYIQGLHILLDYFIDQQEDREGGDLNFCFYYSNEKIMKNRFLYFMEEADKSIQELLDKKFHRLIHQGLVGLYLADPKVKHLPDSSKMTKELSKQSGNNAKFFYWNIRIYNRLKRR